MLDGEAVAFDADTGALQVLNPSATLLWQCFDGRATVMEIAGDVADVFRLTEHEALAQVTELVRQMTELGLLEPASCA